MLKPHTFIRHLRPAPLPPAPTPLRALATLLRHRLETRWYGPWLRPRLRGLLAAYDSEETEKEKGDTGAVSVAKGLRALLAAVDGGGMFASLAVQVHAGDGVEGRSVGQGVLPRCRR